MRGTIGYYDADWLWSLPLIAVTVVVHVSGLLLITQRAARFLRGRSLQHHQGFVLLIIGATAILITCLHTAEAGLWALAYLYLGGMASFHDAILYSLSALTSYGHAAVYLKPGWELMGALEALNGWIVFGLSTAFLFSLIERLWRGVEQ